MGDASKIEQEYQKRTNEEDWVYARTVHPIHSAPNTVFGKYPKKETGTPAVSSRSYKLLLGHKILAGSPTDGRVTKLSWYDDAHALIIIGFSNPSSFLLVRRGGSRVVLWSVLLAGPFPHFPSSSCLRWVVCVWVCRYTDRTVLWTGKITTPSSEQTELMCARSNPVWIDGWILVAIVTKEQDRCGFYVVPSILFLSSSFLP